MQREGEEREERKIYYPPSHTGGPLFGKTKSGRGRVWPLDKEELDDVTGLALLEKTLIPDHLKPE